MSWQCSEVNVLTCVHADAQRSLLVGMNIPSRGLGRQDVKASVHAELDPRASRVEAVSDALCRPRSTISPRLLFRK